MSAERIDVLAVMDDATRMCGGVTDETGARVAEARAAVAELIEAAKGQRCTPCHNSGMLNVRPAPLGNGVITCDPYPCPHCARIRAALASVGGDA